MINPEIDNRPVENHQNQTLLRGILGAIVGAGIGYAIFWGLLKVGIYALVAPGAIAGALAGYFTGCRSLVVGVISLVIATIATIFSEWSMFPFIKDDSLAYFIMHLHELKAMTFILGGLGIAFAFYYGRGSR